MKEIKINRISGEAWKFEFSDEVGIKDVNLLARSLRTQFLRMKQRKRMRARAEARKLAAQPVKELVNG